MCSKGWPNPPWKKEDQKQLLGKEKKIKRKIEKWV
jgi:hypothetical protein